MTMSAKGGSVQRSYTWKWKEMGTRALGVKQADVLVLGKYWQLLMEMNHIDMELAKK